MDKYSNYLEKIGEYGIVKEVNGPIVVVTGIPHTKPTEIIVFETGQFGETFSIGKDTVKVLTFSKEPVRVGTQLTRTGEYLSVPVGEELLGTIIDPFGKPISDKTPLKNIKERREIDGQIRGIRERSRIKKPFSTGVALVDIMIPLGKGQKELVLGDRKTGKTSLLLSAIKQQVQEGAVVVYGVIGKKKSDIKKLQDYFKKEGLDKQIVIVASTSFDSPSLIYLTPYSAMTIGEYFADKGNDVLVILDDLSTHANFYRELSLLGKRFPGRDSYPGDIFYVHAKLLERTGNFKHDKKGEVAITCLPLVETVEGDMTGYIATNIMGMTDGHIYFDTNAYYKGRRPAINISLSVTRVGRQTQSNLKRAINHELAAFLAAYENMQNFSHFGAELSGKVKNILKTGEKIYAFFDQHYNVVIPEEMQILLFALIWMHEFDEKTVDELDTFRTKFLNAYKDKKVQDHVKKITNVNTLDELLAAISKEKAKILSYAA